MRGAIYILLGIVLLCANQPATAADDTMAPPVTCTNGVPGGVTCITSKKDLKAARDAFARGVQLREHKRLQEAFAQFDEAVRLSPQDRQFFTSREIVKAQLVFDHVERGNSLLIENERDLARKEFGAALDLDPGNQYAHERLQEAARDPLSLGSGMAPATIYDSGEIRLHPKDDRATFHYRGDVRGLFSELATAYGVTMQFDDSVQAKEVRFNVEDVDFWTALQLACMVGKTMWAALGPQQALIAADTLENHKQFDRMSLRTFVLPPHSSPQEANELVTTLRNVLELRFINQGQTTDSIEVRGPQSILEACSKLMDQLNLAQKPQVMFDIRVYQIDYQLTRDIGLHIPYTFNLFNIPVAALAALGGQNIQSLINQLIASGGINQAGSSSIAGLLAQLQGQQNSIFSQPLATFGGGLTFSGLSLDRGVAKLSLNESWSRSLEHMTLRAGQGTDATFHLGSRYPILNASYAPIFNAPQISQVLGNQSYIPPFPSVSYEDIGLNVKAKPTVHGDGSVSLQLELQVRSLTGQSANGVPVISNREYKGAITLADGEPAVVAGQVSRTDQLSMAGVPGLASLPGLNRGLTDTSKQESDDELMIIITPHVLSNFARSTQEIWVKR